MEKKLEEKKIRAVLEVHSSDTWPVADPEKFCQKFGRVREDLVKSLWITLKKNNEPFDESHIIKKLDEYLAKDRSTLGTIIKMHNQEEGQPLWVRKKDADQGSGEQIA